MSDVLAIDCWHDPIKVGEKTAGVYVEITFSEGRIGGDRSELPFTFKLNLRRAFMTVRLETPLAFDRARVARSVPEAQAELTRITTAKELAERSLVGKAQISPAALHLALGGEAKSVSQVSQEDQIKLVQTIPEMLVTPRPEGRQGYSWLIEPTFRPNLRGQPWHPVDAPRLFVGSSDAPSPLEPQIFVEIRCAFEDLIISEIEPKDKSIVDKIASVMNGRTREAAAIQHLKHMLIDANLQVSKLDNRFRDILLASVAAAES